MGRFRVSRSVFHHSQPDQIAQNTKNTKTACRRYAGPKTFAVSYRNGRAFGLDNICVPPMVLTSPAQFYTGTAHCGWVGRDEMFLLTLY